MDGSLRISDTGVRVDPEELGKRLAWLENAIDSDHREEVEALQYKTFLFEDTIRIPVLVSTRNDVAHQSQKVNNWPVYTFNQMWNDPAAMLLNELLPVYESILLRDDKVFTIRPNMSQMFIPVLFGAKGIVNGDEPDDMPYINYVPDIDDIEQQIENGIDVESSFIFKKYIEIVNEWRGILKSYPKLSKWLRIALPDLQGPFNTYFLLRGAEAYIDLYENHDLMNRLMGKITELTSKTAGSLASLLNLGNNGYCWNYGYPGLLRNVDDNSTLISRDQYINFIHPWNIQLTKECGGGIHHYCGDGKHIAHDIMSIPGIHGLNFGNPEMQDWDFVRKLSRETQTVLLWDKLIYPIDFKKLSSGGLILKAIVHDIEEGKEYLNELKTRKKIGRKT